MPADHGTPSGLPGSSPGTGARPHVGIIGGGMLGLGLASQLEKSGHRVTVFEAAPTLGGLAAADGIGDVTRIYASCSTRSGWATGCVGGRRARASSLVGAWSRCRRRSTS
jgi:NADPH-dependent 2,4-dienoyl-CoA reductase/sulfur reductase-like enzyme